MDIQPATPYRKLVARPGAALTILFGSFFFFMCVFSLVGSLLLPRISDPVIATRLMTLFQAIFLFIVPALITAVMSTRLPATLLAIDRRPGLWPVILIVLTQIVSIPAMNFIVELNANISLPDSLKPLEDAMRQMEAAAEAATSTLMGGSTIGSLIVTLLIVGVMAGLSEELFFRGAFQRIMQSTRLKPQAAVWIAAFVFSFMHFQFFGFVPRLLLGAFFGYLLLWSNNLWYCIIAHAMNNIMAVLATWSDNPAHADKLVDLNTIGQMSSPDTNTAFIVGISILWTAWGLVKIRRTFKKQQIKQLVK